MILRVIASGSKGNCYALEHSGSYLLLDAGAKLKQILAAVDYTPSAISGALITHEHKDHSRAAADLISRGIDVFSSRGTAEALGISGAYRYTTLAENDQRFIGGFIVRAFPAIHDAAEPLNFLVAASGMKLAYLTDTAYPAATFTGLSFLLVECNYTQEGITAEDDRTPEFVRRRIVNTHMSLDTLVEFVRLLDKSRLRGIMLAHVSGERGDPEEGIRRVSEAAPGVPVLQARPGEDFIIWRK